MTRRGIVSLFVFAFVFFGIAVPPSKSHAADDAGVFILEMSNRAMTALTDPGLDDTVRAERFRQMLREGMDIPNVSERVLGPYIRRATPEELSEFQMLLEENVVRKYAILFKGYSSQAIELVETKQGRNDKEMVSVLIRQKDGSPPIKVNWVVHQVDGAFKVIDIIIERASMVTTLREDFVSVIRRGGGKISALMDELRERNAELAANTSGNS